MIRRSIPEICFRVRASPRKMNAKIATAPGVRTNRGRADESSRCLKEYMIRKNAVPLTRALISIRISVVEVSVVKSIVKRKGIDRISVKIAKMAQKVAVWFFCMDFFS